MSETYATFLIDSDEGQDVVMFDVILCTPERS